MWSLGTINSKKSIGDLFHNHELATEPRLAANGAKRPHLIPAVEHLLSKSSEAAVGRSATVDYQTGRVQT